MKETANITKDRPETVKMIPNRNVVISSIIPHSNDWINSVELSTKYRIRHARADALKKNIVEQYESHLQLVDEFDSLIYFLLCNQLPFWEGMTFTIRGGSKRMKLDRIEYQRHEPSRVCVMRCFLSPVK